MKTRLPNIGPFATPFFGREIVCWEDARSLYWLSRSHANKPFTRLARFFEAQADKFMCGPASLAMVLNAIHMGTNSELPIDDGHEQFPRDVNPSLPSEYSASFNRFTQKNIFKNCEGVVSIEKVYGESPGMNLQEMKAVLEANNVSAKIVEVNEVNPEIHAANFLDLLSRENHYIIANFDRKVWNIKGGGHIAPIGAFDQITKKVLIMDVNMCGRWLWIDLELFIKSMASTDQNTPRGYLIISP
jgi:hypothetical protein